jgi:hypothetical protein
VTWKVLTGQRLFYPRGLAATASPVEPASSGDELAARLGALAHVFDLFMRTADGKAPKPGSLTAFCEELISRLPSAPDQDRARAAVGRLMDINRIRNGRLHTDATNWTESLRRLSVPPVRFQNSATGADLGFYAARSYSLTRPPRMGRRWIRSWERSAPGWSGRGGRSWQLRWRSPAGVVGCVLG